MPHICQPKANMGHPPASLDCYNTAAMKIISVFLFLTITVAVHAQVSERKESITPSAAPARVDAPLHAKVVKLIELTVPREKLQANMPKLLEDGRKRMMEVCPTCTPEFGEEWVKRMKARVKVEDFMDVYVRVYEKYFNDDDVSELLAQSIAPVSNRPPVSPRLQEKLKSLLPTIMGEVVGGCTQVGAKLGGEVGGEIGKEHPEYVRKSEPPSVQP